jgi:hypothetical protein
MPATSKAQQQYFGMIEAGKKKPPKGMSMSQVHDLAATKTKGLPKKAKGAAAGAKSKKRKPPARRPVLPPPPTMGQSPLLSPLPPQAPPPMMGGGMPPGMPPRVPGMARGGRVKKRK